MESTAFRILTTSTRSSSWSTTIGTARSRNTTPCWTSDCFIQCRDFSRYPPLSLSLSLSRSIKISANGCNFTHEFHPLLSSLGEKQDDEIANTTDIAKVMQKFVELEKEISDSIRQYQHCLDLYGKTAYEVQLKRQSLEAFSEAIKMFEEQIKLQEKFQKEAQPHEIST